MKRISEVTFLLVAIAFGGVRGECDKCNADNPVACHSETVYSLCLNDQPTMKFVTCPLDYICTSDAFVCYPRDSAVASCGRTNPVEDGLSKCGVCASRDKLYACLNETTIAFCFGADVPYYESLSYCPANTVCDLNRKSGFCTPATQDAPSCIPSQWTTPISTMTTPVPTSTIVIPTTTYLPIPTTSVPTTTTDIPTTDIPTATSFPTTTTPVSATTTDIPTTTSFPTPTTITDIPTTTSYPTTTDIPTTTSFPTITTPTPTTTTDIPTTTSFQTTTTPIPTTTTDIHITTSFPTTTTSIPTTTTDIPTTTSFQTTTTRIPTTTTDIHTTTSFPSTTTSIPTTTTDIPTTTSFPTTTTTTTPIPITTTDIPTTTSFPTTTTPIPTTTTTTPVPTTTSFATTTTSIPTTTTTTLPTTTTPVPTTTPLLVTTTVIPITTTEHKLTPEEICEKHGKEEAIPLPDDLTCKKSIRCKKSDNVWKADISTCPPNQWFDPGFKFCTATYKCPTQTTSIPITTTPVPTTTPVKPTTTSIPITTTVIPIITTEHLLTPEEICEKHGKEEAIPLPDDLTCKKSIRCKKNGNVWKADLSTCPTNQWFDPGLKFCTATYKCSTQSPPATTSTPDPTTTTKRTLTLEEICENHGEPGNIALPDDPTCKKYIVCSKPGPRWIAQANTCRNFYDPTINKCSSTYKCQS